MYNVNTLKITDVGSFTKPYTINYNFTDGGYIDIMGAEPGEFLVEFIDQKNQNLVLSEVISNNMWLKTPVKYFVNFHVTVTALSTNQIIFEHDYNPTDKRVYIPIDSVALGDAIAWMPFIEEFKNIHQCDVITSSRYNDLFEDNYPDLTFVHSSDKVEDIYAMYKLGLFYDNDGHGYPGDIQIMMNPSDFRDYQLSKIATEILGLEYRPLKSRVVYQAKENMYGKYVCIAPHGSSVTKGWHYPNGWQLIIDYLTTKGYNVLLISREKLGVKEYDDRLGGKLTGVIDKTGHYSLADRASDIKNAELYIGIGSGLSWLAWAIEAKTILISGFSKPYTEFSECERVFTPEPSTTCNGCFNHQRLDIGSRDWCPVHNHTERRFECSKTIEAKTVIEKIDKLLGLN